MSEQNILDKSMRSVFVGNIPYEATEEKLKDIFNEVGPVISFKLVYDRETGKPKGYGFCEYKDQETALSAMRNLNGYEIGGRTLRVDNACTEKSRLEMQSLMMGMPTSEGHYGESVSSEKAPEVINKIMANLPSDQLYELMKQMKDCIQNNPVEARNMLLQNPQLAYALLQAQVIMKAVEPEVAKTMLYPMHKVPVAVPKARPVPPTPKIQPMTLTINNINQWRRPNNLGYKPQAQPNHMDWNSMNMNNTKNIRPDFRQSPNQMSFSQLPNRMPFPQPPNQMPFQQPPNQMSFLQPPNQMSFPQPPNQMSFPRPPPSFIERSQLFPNLRNNFHQVVQNNRAIGDNRMNSNYMALPPPQIISMNMSRPPPMIPPQIARSRMIPPNSMPPQSMPPNSMLRNPMPPNSMPPYSMPPNSMSRPFPEQPMHQRMAQPSQSQVQQQQPKQKTSDSEKAALIMQVLHLTDAQIAMLPADQRQSIIQLKQKILSSTKRKE